MIDMGRIPRGKVNPHVPHRSIPNRLEAGHANDPSGLDPTHIKLFRFPSFFSPDENLCSLSYIHIASDFRVFALASIHKDSFRPLENLASGS